MRNARAQGAQRVQLSRALELAPTAPDAAILAYSKALRGYAEKVERLVEKRVLARLPFVGSGDPLDVVGLQLGLAQLELDLVELAPKLARFARAAGKRTASHAEREILRMLGVDIREPVIRAQLVEDFTRRNVELLRRIAFDQVKRIKRAIDTYQDGESMRARILHSLWVSRNRTKLIGFDQPHKFSNELQAYWASGLGEDSYVYITRDDGRVRESHVPHHGKVFRNDTPPNTGHPGTQPNCRCARVPLGALTR